MRPETDDQVSRSPYVIKKPARKGQRSRSVYEIPDTYKEITRRASVHVRSYTLFENPMLNIDEMSLLLHDSWTLAEQEVGKSFQRVKEIDYYVSMPSITPCVGRPTQGMTVAWHSFECKVTSCLPNQA